VTGGGPVVAGDAANDVSSEAAGNDSGRGSAGEDSHDETLPQLAERLGRSVPSVASILRRGLEQPRKRLKNEPL
jgi:hypothetical protein